MYRLTAKIEITGAKSWRLEKVTEVEITRDTEKLTDECRLTLPKKIKWDGAAEIPVQRGDGQFVSASHKETSFEGGGKFILLFPGEWHSYRPSPKTGWHEYWIGFRGEHVDDRYNNGFFSRGRIIHPIGLREHIIDQYREALDIALREKTGSQQVLASIANIILSYVIYYDLNDTGRDIVAEKMDRARSIMRENMLAGITPEEVAANVEKLLDRFAEESPWTKIYVQSILPVNGVDTKAKPKNHWKKGAEIIETNKLLETLCEGRKNVMYVDVYSALVDEKGMLDKQYTNDGLHLMGEGYLAWKTVIEKFVR